MRVIVYEHFVVTLKEELQMRIKTQEPFAKKELWFLLYALACGAIEMMQIREFTHSVEDI
jgi:NADH:ubiquinone oxidoreductase subunit B-like Fe-S oxidoreductase